MTSFEPANDLEESSCNFDMIESSENLTSDEY